MHKVAITVGAGALPLVLGACSTTVTGRPQDAAPKKAAVRVHATLSIDIGAERISTVDAGLGDWNVPWPQWQAGGLL